MGIVLASASPRRRELLSMLNVKDYRVIPAVGEEHIEKGKTPIEIVCSLSKEKAEEVSKNCSPSDIIIAADTIVVLDGEVLGKPCDESEAFRMLTLLSGREHEVFTGVTIIQGGSVFSEFEKTLVRFREISKREIDAYIQTGEPMDKAGSYGAQGIGSLFIEGIEGDFFNVMGLPLCRLSRMLEKLGVILI